MYYLYHLILGLSLLLALVIFQTQLLEFILSFNMFEEKNRVYDCVICLL